ncbi:phenylalanine 4-monooxygenase [Flectobacillus major]|uniref:phenylalanine 4-monooxygenase n=1 Tax=Flectobacillus major TaxID=103 RepID=UPI001E5221AD|nr:phenylalanine 4-monooxygenase [Flectobacillus major]
MKYDFKPFSMHQVYENYTQEDFEVWKILFERQMQQLPSVASKEYLEGIKRVNFSASKIPNYDETNALLSHYTGWRIHVVPGLIANRPFFELMQAKNFCASTWLRSRSQLAYLEEPDMFHDIFGHVPLLSNQSVCHFLEELARIALRFVEDEEAVEYIARLYWYTVEFGLIHEDGALKIYGAGILSSSGESVYCLENTSVKRLPYHIKMIFDTPYIKDRFQAQYFVIDSYAMLFDSIPEIEAELEQRMALKHKKTFNFHDSEIGYHYASI